MTNIEKLKALREVYRNARLARISYGAGPEYSKLNREDEAAMYALENALYAASGELLAVAEAAEATAGGYSGFIYTNTDYAFAERITGLKAALTKLNEVEI
jgi:hypothetical protein